MWLALAVIVAAIVLACWKLEMVIDFEYLSQLRGYTFIEREFKRIGEHYGYVRD